MPYFWYQSLEESRGTFVPRHIGQDAEAALGVVEVTILNTRLDDVERRRNNERGGGTGDRCNKVLEPSRLVIVLETEEELLGKGGTTEELS